MEERFDQVTELRLVFAREEIEAGAIDSALRSLQRLISSAAAARAFMGKVTVYIAGYEDDPRQPWEIDEVRRWMAALDEKFPFWFYFLKSSSILRVMLCLWQLKEVSKDRVYPEPDGVWDSIEYHLAVVGWLRDHLDLPEEEVRGRMNEALMAFVGLHDPP